MDPEKMGVLWAGEVREAAEGQHAAEVGLARPAVVTAVWTGTAGFVAAPSNQVQVYAKDLHDPAGARFKLLSVPRAEDRTGWQLPREALVSDRLVLTGVFKALEVKVFGYALDAAGPAAAPAADGPPTPDAGARLKRKQEEEEGSLWAERIGEGGGGSRQSTCVH